MKKIVWMALTIAILSFIFLSTSLVNPPQAHASSYNGLNPVSTGCANTATQPVPYASLADGFGTVYLEWSTACQTAWARVVFSQPLGTYAWGNAYIISNTTGNIYSCGEGGDGYVAPGQRSCYTGMVDDPDGYSAYAKGKYQATLNGHVYMNSTSSW